MSNAEWVQLYPSDKIKPDARLHQANISFDALRALANEISGLFAHEDTSQVERDTTEFRYGANGIEVWYQHTLTPAEATVRERDTLKALFVEVGKILPGDDRSQLKAEDVARVAAIVARASNL